MVGRCHLTTLTNAGYIVLVIWIPAHCGIEGNEAADAAASATACQAGIPTAPSAIARRLSSLTVKRLVELYLQKTAPTDCHRQASGGQPAPWVDRPRADLVTLQRLRLNRAPWLRDTQFR